MDRETVNLVLNVVTIILGTGFFGAWLNHQREKKALAASTHSNDRDDDREDFNTITAELTRQRNERDQRITQLEQRQATMEAEIQGLKLTRDLDPFPHWVVDRAGEYLYANREFERYFLEPKGQTYRDVLGKKHEDIGWPREFCETLRALDAAARSRPDGTARAVTALEVPEFGETVVTVHKFPIRFKPSGVIVAYAGYITDIEAANRPIG